MTFLYFLDRNKDRMCKTLVTLHSYCDIIIYKQMIIQSNIAVAYIEQLIFIRFKIGLLKFEGGGRS